MRKSSYFILSVTTGALLLLGVFFHAAWQRSMRGPELDRQAALVRRLELTDLCLFTEARYTRHVSLADMHAPFQDHPTALDHFPTGSFFPPQRTPQNRFRGAH
jgi:hypothetical protein